VQKGQHVFFCRSFVHICVFFLYF